MTYEEAVWQDPERMSGAICFRNDRIPVRTLFDYLAATDLEGFFHAFPDVPREAVDAILAEARRRGGELGDALGFASEYEMPEGEP